MEIMNIHMVYYEPTEYKFRDLGVSLFLCGFYCMYVICDEA